MFDESGYNIQKVCTKEELVKLLQEYKGILNHEMIDYLNSLIELEFSVIREYIKNNDRKVLSELEIYKRIAIYNIYFKALNLFKSMNIDFDIYSNEQDELDVQYKMKDKVISIFNFDYSDEFIDSNSRIISDSRSLGIGEICLWQSIESSELREAELDRIMVELQKLYYLKFPNSCKFEMLGGFKAALDNQRLKKIDFYEKRFSEIYNRKVLSDEDKTEIEITKQVHDLLLSDYGLCDECFEEVIQHFNNYEDASQLNKKMIKKMPNLIITNRIKYI